MPKGTMELINQFLADAVGLVWNLPLVLALLGTGIFVSLGLGGIQFKGFVHAFHVITGKFDKKNEPGEITHFQALTSALSATVGLGNIAGVAIAIHVGGPGATFWMIVGGLIGMATKFAECTLAVKYRRVDEKGVVHGGPMHYIEQGLGKTWKPMAYFYAFGCMISSFGAGNMFQSNSVADIFESNFGIPAWLTGIVLVFFVAIVIIGGIKRIGQVTSKLVPTMAVIYIFGALTVIFGNFSMVPDIIMQIFHDAFNGTAAAGGAAGIALRTVIVQGIRRATFSNEAGMGSAAIAHSAAKTNEPVREGVVALLEPFIDTVVICTMTALVIIISGEWIGGDANGVLLTAAAFSSVIPGFGQYFIPIAVGLFAYSTLISWSYYGERSADYLWGDKGVIAYKVIFCVFVFIGAIWHIDPVINFADMIFGLLAIPNLIAIWLLFPKLRAETKSYFERMKGKL